MIHFAPWKIVMIAVVLLAGVVFAAPNLVSRALLDELPDWLPTQQVNLGLDLQGGSHLLLEVDTQTYIRKQLDGIVDAMRLALRGANVGYSDLGVEGNIARVTLRDPSQMETARPLLEEIAGSDLDLEIADDGKVTIGFGDAALKARVRQVLAQSIEIVRRRIDETGTREPTIQRQGDDRILVQLPGIKDPERVEELLKQTATLTFQFVTDILPGGAPPTGAPPAGNVFMPSAEQDAADTPRQYYAIERRIIVSGENLTNAQASFQDGEPVVSFRFDSVGAKRFGEATSENVGKLFAIVLDNKVISAPRINEPILGGSGIISGSFTTQTAQDLALLLRAGALPADLRVLEKRTVGADLGADSIDAGKIASVIGLVLVVVAMIVAYGLFGLFANIALLCNGILLLALLSALQATLTLPGIAGIVLTLGMAVDANVLVFERIREEIRAGRGPVTAIDAGYKEALSTIMDANLTTLISTVILYAFGSGPVKGFAVTLGFGIVTSVFTAVMVTRLVTVLWLRRARPKALPL